MSELPEVLSVVQAAAELNISERAVRHRIKAGTLSAIKTGPGTAAYVIPRAAIEAAIAKVSGATCEHRKAAS